MMAPMKQPTPFLRLLQAGLLLVGLGLSLAMAFVAYRWTTTLDWPLW